jgi:hypothetical protein
MKNDHLIAKDANTGEFIKRPIIDSRYKYDLDLKPPESEVWQYVCSSNYIELFSTEKYTDYLKSVNEVGVLWRIIDVKKGKIVKTNESQKI